MSSRQERAEVWLTGRQAARLTGMNQHSLLKYAALGKVTIRAEAGESIRYRRLDLERLAAEEGRP